MMCRESPSNDIYYVLYLLRRPIDPRAIKSRINYTIFFSFENVTVLLHKVVERFNIFSSRVFSLCVYRIAHVRGNIYVHGLVIVVFHNAMHRIRIDIPYCLVRGSVLSNLTFSISRGYIRRSRFS